MNSLIVLSTVLALSLYVPLCIQIFKGKVEQNFATWFLWTTLDGVVAGTLIVQHGNYLLPVAYTIGSAVTSIFILRSNSMRWTRFESFVAFLVMVCVIVWIFSGAKIATIASTAAMIIAGIPQLFESYRKPWNTPILIYLGYFAANSLSVLGAKSWQIEERLYPFSAAVYCLIVSLLAMRKSSIKNKQQAECL